LARQAQALEDATPRGHAHPHARLHSDAGAQLVSGESRIVVHQLAEQDMGRLGSARSLPAGMRLRGNGPRRTVLAEHVLDERQTDPEQVRQGTL
jgi:hypothetical protein